MKQQFDRIVADAEASFQPHVDTVNGISYVPLFPKIVISKTRLRALLWAQKKLSKPAAPKRKKPGDQS